jgi:PAS domain S-box-containing protein
MSPAVAPIILLVEDDPGIGRLEQLRLERAGYTVVRAATAREGLEQIASGRIALIIVDQQLSESASGLEFYREVREGGHDIPAILVTGLQDDRLLVEALRAGVRDFVPKTSHFLDHLEPIVARVLDQARTERELADSRTLSREQEARRVELEHEIAQRKRVELALRAAEESWSLMVESVRDFAIFTVDPAGKIATWNRGGQHLFGYSEAEILGRPFAILFTAEDQAGGTPAQEIAAAAAKGRSADERWHIRRDGSRFFASGSLTPILDEDSRLRGFTKVCRDITAQKEAQEAVREAAVRLKAIVDTASDGIITIGEAGIVESMNLAAERIFGYASEQVVGQSAQMLMAAAGGALPHPDGERFWSAFEPNMIGRAREIEGRKSDGSTFPMELSISETRLGDRCIFTGIVRDITDYKRAVVERMRLVSELGAERALLNSLLDNAPVGFGFFDHAERYLRINPALAAIDGLPVEEHLGRRLDDVVPALAAEASQAFQAVKETGQSIVNKEITGETPQFPGQKRSWLCNFYPVRTSDGNLLGTGLVVSDIDDRKRMEEALKEADRRKDQFLAMLAHELRNPLAPISNAVQIMRVEGPSGPSFQWSLTVIADQIKHMTRMVDDLLDVSRITRGKVDLQRQLIELADVVSIAVEASRPLLEEYRHHLTVELPNDSVLLDADPARIAQVLSNLLNNAAKYTPERGEISLLASVTRNDVLIRVRDSGIGISPDLLPRMFDLFVQADQSLSRTRGGLGIGLTVVRSLVEMHDGSVSVHSKGSGKGSEFTIRLPRPSRSVSRGHERSRLDRSGGVGVPPRRILVVDDSLKNAASLEVLLRAMGHEVHIAHDGAAALELVRQVRPDVVLLDIGLPLLDGYEVARRCRQDPELRNLVLVALTGYGQEEDRARSRKAGFNAHLVKPVDIDKLRQVLDENGSPRRS